jgi:hypothetical protein
MTAQKLPTDSQTRKDTPVYSGCLAYFPLALAAIARWSQQANEKHNPGQPLHWSREKSADHVDCLTRHLLEVGTIDPNTGVSHSVNLAWRALALLQLEEEARMAGAALTAAAYSRLVSTFDPPPMPRYCVEIADGRISYNHGLHGVTFESAEEAEEAIKRHGSQNTKYVVARVT